MKRDRHAVAGKGGNDRSLVAEAEQAGRLSGIRGMEIAVRDLEDRERTLEERLRASQARAQVRAIIGDAVEQSVPALADLRRSLVA